jgi:hypothetical protein
MTEGGPTYEGANNRRAGEGAVRSEGRQDEKLRKKRKSTRKCSANVSFTTGTVQTALGTFEMEASYS